MNKISKEQSDLKEQFDEEFYLSQLQGEKPRDLWKHYVSKGVEKGLDPSPFFSTEYYLLEYEDIRKNGINPFEHYILFGKEEGRRVLPSKRVDAAAVFLAQGGKIPYENALLILRAHQQPPVSGNVDENHLFDYIRDGWRNHTASVKSRLWTGSEHPS